MRLGPLLRRSTVDIELYKVRNPHKKTFSHILPLVAVPKCLTGAKVVVATGLGRGEQQKSLVALKELYLLEYSIKSTKKRKRVIPLYLVTQSRPSILADRKKNQPKLERLMLPLPKVVAGKKGNGVVMFLNSKPVYKQLVSKSYAISGYHWVHISTQGFLLSKRFHPDIGLSWFTTSDQALVHPGSLPYPDRVRREVALIKSSKKGSHPLVDTAPLKIQKGQIQSFFKHYLLYLKKLISQPGNLPLSFLITKLNRSILSWQNDLYLRPLPGTQRRSVKTRTNNTTSGGEEPFFPLPTLAGFLSANTFGSIRHTNSTSFSGPGTRDRMHTGQCNITYGRLPDVVTTYGKPITQVQAQDFKTKPQSLEHWKKKQQFQYLNFYISKLLWKQVKKKHPTQSNRWLFEKYWKFVQNRPRFYIVSNKRLFVTIMFGT